MRKEIASRFKPPYKNLGTKKLILVPRWRSITRFSNFQSKVLVTKPSFSMWLLWILTRNHSYYCAMSPRILTVSILNISPLMSFSSVITSKNPFYMYIFQESIQKKKSRRPSSTLLNVKRTRSYGQIPSGFTSKDMIVEKQSTWMVVCLRCVFKKPIFSYSFFTIVIPTVSYSWKMPTIPFFCQPQYYSRFRLLSFGILPVPLHVHTS